MATKLNKPITRELYLQGYDRGWRDIVVTLQGDCVVVKLKGLKASYPVSFRSILADAFKGLPLQVRESV